MRFLKKLQDQVITIAGDTGNNLQLAGVPAAVGGRVNYVDKIILAIAFTLTFTNTAMGVLSAAGVRPQGIVNQVLLSIPQVGILVQISGDELVRLYRLRHAGDYPPSTVTTTGTGTTPLSTLVTAGTIFDGVTPNDAMASAMGNTVISAFTMDIPIEFADPGARDADDFAIPAALLASAEFKVTWGASLATLGPICTGAFTNCVAPTLSAATCVTTVESRARKDIVIPKLTTLQAVNYNGVEPNLDPIGASISHLAIAPQAVGGLFTAADYTMLGTSFGGNAFVISEDVLPTGRLVDSFNLESRTDIEDPTAAQTQRSNFIPIVWAPDNKKGQHLTSEVVPAGLKPRIMATTSVGTYKLIRRSVWAAGGWLSKVRSLLGIAPNANGYIVTANGVGGPRALAVADLLPIGITIPPAA